MTAVVTVKLLGDDTQLNAMWARQSGAADSFAAKMKASGAAMESVGRTLTHGVTVPVLAVAAAATKMAYDYQQAVQKVVNLSSNLGQTSAQVSKMVLDASNASGVSATDLANAYYEVAAAGYKGATAQQILTEGAQMSAVGMGAAVDTTNALIGVINVYGEANLNAAKAADVFTSIVQNSKFAPADLAASLGRVLPYAQQLGVSFQDLGGDLAALSHVGLSADASVTGMTAVFSNLTAATKSTGNASKEMASLGLNAQNVLKDLGTKGTIATLDEINAALVKQGGAANYTASEWQDLATGLGESVDQVKQQFGKLNLGALQKIFPNKKAFITFLGLTDENNVAAQQAAKTVASGVVGTLAKAFAQWSGSDVGKMQIAINDLKNGLIDLGDKILPKLADWIQNIASWWDKLGPKTQDQVEHFALMAAEIGPLLLVGGKLVSMLGNMSKLLSASPWALAIAAFGELYLNSESFRNAVNDLVKALSPLAQHLDIVKAAAGALATYLTLSTLAPTFLALGSWVGKLGQVKVAEEGVTTAAEAMTGAEALGALGAAGPIAGLGALAVGVGYASFKFTEWALGSGSPKNLSQQAKDLTAQLAPVANQLRDVQGPITGADTRLQALAQQLAINADKMPGTGDAAVNLGKMLTQNLGLDASTAKTALEDMGFSAQDAQSILNGFSSASIDGQLANVIRSADAAASALANEQNAVKAAGGFNVFGGVGSSTYGPTVPAALQTAINNAAVNVPTDTAPSGGGGTGGGSGGSSGSDAAAKSAATAAKKAAAVAAAEANASMLGKPLLDMEAWLVGGEPNTGKDGPITTAAKAMAAEIKKNFTVKGGTVPAAATAAMSALTDLATQASTFNTGFQTNLTKGADFVSVFESTGAGSADIKSYLQDQVAKVQRLGTDLKTLSGRGVPASILQMLANAGIDGVDIADSLVASNSADLSTIIGLGNTLTAASQSIANQTESEIFTNPAALPKSVGAAAPLKATKDAKGHTITVNVSSNASPKAIAKEIAWQLKTASK